MGKAHKATVGEVIATEGEAYIRTVILLSGYSHTEIVLQRGWKFIQKPFQPQELRAAMEDSFKYQKHAS